MSKPSFIDSIAVTFRCPSFVIAIWCDESMLLSVSYLPSTTKDVLPQNLLAKECYKQLQAYFSGDKKSEFDLPLATTKTVFAAKVQHQLQQIPYGQVLTYGEISNTIKTSARAIGASCRANQFALIVPCHRVVSASGIGGFMGTNDKHEQYIKKYLLQHEGAVWKE